MNGPQFIVESYFIRNGDDRRVNTGNCSTWGSLEDAKREARAEAQRIADGLGGEVIDGEGDCADLGMWDFEVVVNDVGVALVIAEDQDA